MTETSAPDGPARMQPVLARLRSLGPCSDDLESQVLALGGRIETVAAKTIVSSEGAPVRRPRYILSGWACRYRHLSDGRRQIFDLALPGDGVGLGLNARPFASLSTMALTELRWVDASALTLDGHDVWSLPAARARADADEERALRQIMRLGCMTALERLADLFLELHARLDVVGQTDGPRFACPLTQETLADMTGLSVVHVNRTLQELRRKGLMTVERGWVRLGDTHLLAEITDPTPAVRRVNRGHHL